MSKATASGQPRAIRDSPNVSIIVVSYNTRDLTLACLRSVFAETRRHTFEFIVVDNASTDGSAEAIRREFPDIRVVASKENLGFAGGNNLAAAETRGEWLLLLNPDTVVLDGAIDTLLDFASRRGEAAIFGGRTLFSDGSLNPTSCWARATLWSSFTAAIGLTAAFRGSRLFDPEAMGDWHRDTARKVDIVTGCFFLLRKSDWECLGGFDERFHVYGEETDLCLRAAQLGLNCMICPDARIVHYGGASEKARAGKMVRLFRAKSQLYSKHWSGSAAWLGTRTLDLWALVRVIAFAGGELLGIADGESLQTWLEVWRNRQSWHLTRDEMAGRAPARQSRIGKNAVDFSRVRTSTRRQRRVCQRKVSPRMLTCVMECTCPSSEFLRQRAASFKGGWAGGRTRLARWRPTRTAGQWRAVGDWDRSSSSSDPGGLSDILCARPVSSLADEALAEDDGELGSGLDPLTRRSFPFLGGVVENQI